MQTTGGRRHGSARVSTPTLNPANREPLDWRGKTQDTREDQDKPGNPNSVGNLAKALPDGGGRVQSDARSRTLSLGAPSRNATDFTRITNKETVDFVEPPPRRSHGAGKKIFGASKDEEGVRTRAGVMQLALPGEATSGVAAAEAILLTFGSFRFLASRSVGGCVLRGGYPPPITAHADWLRACFCIATLATPESLVMLY